MNVDERALEELVSRLIYDGRLMRLEGEQVDIVNALGTRFNYPDLMAGR